MVTRVVHVRSRIWQETPPEQRVYVGRRAAGFPASRWANPYKMAQESDRAAVLDLYRRRLRALGPAIVGEIRRDIGPRLVGCWCAPRDGCLTAADPLVCHGQIIAEITDGGEP